MFDMRKITYRCTSHLTPRRGWLNDPNGLCLYNGTRHIFFQSSPEYPAAGPKGWGHYSTKDFKNYTFHGLALRPDNDFDRDGVYSGSAIERGGRLYLFYTGNVKERGDYDYINSGRLATVFCVTTDDGVSFSPKRILLKNCDYPEYYSCHVRDPKVWQEGESYYMVLGGRTKDGRGALLFYTSPDLLSWRFYADKIFSDFGYMLECPDVFYLNGKKVYSFCPQGVAAEGENFRNLFSSGYCIGEVSRQTYREWDKGYDFYAPQTYDDGGRRILVGWAGIADAALPYAYDATLPEGWIHCLTTFRELKERDGRIYCFPIEEVLSLATGYERATSSPLATFFAKIELAGDAKITLGGCFDITADGDGNLTFGFSQNGFGREERTLSAHARELFIFFDRSIAEIYINGGEQVFTSRIFGGRGIEASGAAKCEVSGVEEFSYEEADCNR